MTIFRQFFGLQEKETVERLESSKEHLEKHLERLRAELADSHNNLVNSQDEKSLLSKQMTVFESKISSLEDEICEERRKFSSLKSQLDLEVWPSKQFDSVFAFHHCLEHDTTIETTDSDCVFVEHFLYKVDRK